MVQRSDDKGDKRSQGKTTEGGASRDAESNAANALRERIRQAGAATARASDHAPPDNGLLVPNSSAPPTAEHSGIRTRPPEPRATSTTPPLFGPPRLTPGAMSVPWPSVPRKRDVATTRMGLGPPQPDPARESNGPVDPLRATLPSPTHPPARVDPSDDEEDPSQRTTDRISLPAALAESAASARRTQPTPRGVAPPPEDDWVLSNAQTQEMPRVRDVSDFAPSPPADADERRRAEFATTRKTHGLLRAPDAGGSNAGRYSVHDVSTEYVDTGKPEVAAPEYTVTHDDAPEVTVEPGGYATESEVPQSGEAGADTRPRRSTPKQRVGHRRSSRPEIGHARERGTKRTDPGIRARTLRGGAAAATLPGTKIPAAHRAAAKAQPSPLPAASTPQPPPQQSPQPHALPLPAAKPPVRRPSPEDSSVVVDPSLGQLPAQSALPVKYEASSYVPLPRDREAYEAFLRSAAGEHGPPRARPVWAQQETALIPRDALEPSFEDDADASVWRGAYFRGLLGVVLIVISASVLWWLLQDDSAAPRANDSARNQTQLAPSTTSPTPAPPVAAGPITLIATEPSGAELLLDGAVVGNTPFEVTRPAQGEVLYLVRLKDFEHQMVRITSATHDAIHITLVPVTPAAPAAKRR